jgi:hypothetical protein
MSNSEFRVTRGTSALKPGCSRYSNENERIIDFGSAAARWESQIDYARLAKARHARTSDRIRAGIVAVADKSGSLRSVRTGSIAGTPCTNLDGAWKMKVYGGVYAAIGLSAVLMSL